MKSKVYYPIIIVFLLFAPLASAQEPARAKVNLNNTRYVGYLPVNVDGEMTPGGPYYAPVYITLGQRGDKIYGNMTVAAFDDPTKVDPWPGMSLITYPLSAGVVKGKAFGIDKLDPTGMSKIETMKWKALKGGAIRAALSGPNGKVLLLMTPITDPQAGIYIGKYILPGQPAPDVDNIVYGVENLGDVTNFYMTFRYPTDAYIFFSLKGSFLYDETTDEMVWDGGEEYGELRFDGSISKGRMIAESSLGTVVAYQNGDTAYRLPKSSKAKPNKLGSGLQEIKLKCKNAMASALVTLASDENPSAAAQPEIYIVHYRVEKAAIYIALQVDKGVAGKYHFVVTNPNGRSAASKDIIIK